MSTENNTESVIKKERFKQLQRASDSIAVDDLDVARERLVNFICAIPEDTITRTKLDDAYREYYNVVYTEIKRLKAYIANSGLGYPEQLSTYEFWKSDINKKSLRELYRRCYDLALSSDMINGI